MTCAKGVQMSTFGHFGCERLRNEFAGLTSGDFQLQLRGRMSADTVVHLTDDERKKLRKQLTRLMLRVHRIRKSLGLAPIGSNRPSPKKP